MGYTLIEVTEPADWHAYHAIRRQELFEARGRHGIYDENYPGERAANMHPYLLKLDGQPLGTTRLDVREDGSAFSASLPSRPPSRDVGMAGSSRKWWKSAPAPLGPAFSM